MPPAGAAQRPRCRRPWRDHPYRTAAWQITIEDALSGRRETIEARALVNAAGLMTSHVPVIDQGTTSSRAIAFRADCTVAAIAQRTVLATGREAPERWRSQILPLLQEASGALMGFRQLCGNRRVRLY